MHGKFRSLFFDYIFFKFDSVLKAGNKENKQKIEKIYLINKINY